MEDTLFDLMEFWKKPSLSETMVDLLLCAVPIWLAVMIGLVIGWSWRPRWTSILFLGLRSKFRIFWGTVPPGFGSRRLWFVLSVLSIFRTVWFSLKGNRAKSPDPVADSQVDEQCNEITASEDRERLVSEDDLQHFLELLEGNDGSMEWQHLMEKATSNMTYEAWCHEPKTGPFILRSRTVFEDASPELIRDFFWDDEFRAKWDPMLGHCKILEEYPRTGVMVVQWIRKFPFFCSDREYIIGQRIWEDRKTYYCITKGVPYPLLPKRKKPKRVDLYFSSWIIKSVESSKRDGLKTACEVSLVHYEDMGIPRDVAKLGVRHGMWGTVKRLHSAVRSYQIARKTDMTLCRSVLMAHSATKISLCDAMNSNILTEDEGKMIHAKDHKDHRFDWKWLLIGGTIALVCGVHSCTVGRTLLLGAGQRIARK